MKLQDAFPNLTLFADMDWNAVTAEYEQTSKYVSFPEYLAIKAEEGDCPQHLYELAYFDAALTGLQEGEFTFPDAPGIHLNPSARFLSLDHDILKMVTEAYDGKIDVIERANVLCLFVSEEGEICFHELSETELDFLQTLEEGKTQMNKAPESLTDRGLVLSI